MKATETLETMQAITDACLCKASTQSHLTDRGLYICLPVPYCRDTLMYVDFLPKRSSGALFVWEREACYQRLLSLWKIPVMDAQLEDYEPSCQC